MMISDWLEKEFIPGKKVKEVVTEYIYVNYEKFGTLINVGKTVLTPELPFGRRGLNIQEAFQFVELCGVVKGFLFSSDHQEQVKTDFDAKIREVAEEEVNQLRSRIAIPDPEQTQLLGNVNVQQKQPIKKKIIHG